MQSSGGSAKVGALLLAMVASCASGSGGSEPPPQDGPAIKYDAGLDATPPLGDAQNLDGPVDTMPPDMTPVPTDAPPGSNLFCASNGDCTIAGECCFDFFGESPQGFCVTNSSPIPGVCIPPL